MRYNSILERGGGDTMGYWMRYNSILGTGGGIPMGYWMRYDRILSEIRKDTGAHAEIFM